MIKIESLQDEIDREIDRLAQGPTLKDLLEFETALATEFQATQSVVHVITGSLKLSGKVSSDFSNNTWKGEITYGGSSTGIHNPVDYAEIERERDGGHDYFRPVKGLSAAYISAMQSFLGG